MKHKKTALVVGASGGMGSAIAKALVAHGWNVRGLSRNIRTAKSQRHARMEWVQGDAMVRGDVVAAANGVSVIVHAVNPPNYMNWDRYVLPMIDNTIAAARSVHKARIVLPGTIYNYDPSRTPVIRDDTPQEPQSRKGAIRVALEQRLEDAAPEVPSLILRSGESFGPGAVKASWFARAMVKPGKPVRRILNMARSHGHSWAYLPDVAETFARLLDAQDQLRPFERVQFEGLYDQDGMALIEALRRVTGRNLPVRRFPWWLVHVLSRIGGWPYEASEIAQYWSHPVRLDNSRLVELIGPEPRTELDDAVRQSLKSLGSLEVANDTPRPIEGGQLDMSR